MIVGTFLMLLLVFTFFELLKDLGRVPITVIGQTCSTVTPYFLYNSTPMSMLLAVLITFGLLEKTNEITAMKATGVSIYRIIIPVLVVAAMVSAGLFFFDQLYLPQLNKKQDALRNEIKGKPAADVFAGRPEVDFRARTPASGITSSSIRIRIALAASPSSSSIPKRSN